MSADTNTAESTNAGASPRGYATDPALTNSSYVVLGLIARYGAMTPYDLKQRVGESVGFFWGFPHAQLYTEPPRLVRYGLLTEEREGRGRRRRTFSLTAAGRQALDDWLASPVTDPVQMRDPALLRLFFADLNGTDDLRRLAESQLAVHTGRLAMYRERAATLTDEPAHRARARMLSIGQRIEEAHISFWGSLLE